MTRFNGPNYNRQRINAQGHPKQEIWVCLAESQVSHQAPRPFKNLNAFALARLLASDLQRFAYACKFKARRQ